MAITIQYFYSKLREQIPDTVLVPKDDSSTFPTLRSLGIISPSMRDSDDILYVDFGTHDSADLLKNKSVVTNTSRAGLFSESDCIVVPDSCDVDATFWLLSDILTGFRSWLDHVHEALKRRDSLQEVVDYTSELLGNPLYIANASFKMMVNVNLDLDLANPVWRYQRHYGYMPYDAMQSLIETGELKRMGAAKSPYIEKNSSVFPFDYLCSPIRRGNRTLGYFFVIRFYHDLTFVDLEIAELLSEILSASDWQVDETETEERFYQAYFVESVIDGNLTDPIAISRQLKPFNWKLEGDYVLFVLRLDNDNDAIRHHVMALFDTMFDAQSLIYHDDVVAIIADYTTRRESVHELLNNIVSDYNRWGALSEEFSHFQDLASYYEQACYALDEGIVKEERAHLLTYTSFFLHHSMELVERQVTEYEPALKLIRYDDTHGGDLCHSLVIWLLNERNTVHAAKELYIHRNTLTYRLEKVEKLLGLDLDDWHVRFRLLYTLRDFIDSLPEESEEPK